MDAGDAARRVSVLREVRPGERRVILLPDAVATFVREGFEALVERGAGHGVGAGDDDYVAAGARIVDTETAWASPLVLKYKAPAPEEYRHLRPGLTLGAFYHAEGAPALVRALREGGVSAYAYEFFRTATGEFPLVVPDTEISGKLAVVYGAYYLRQHAGGRGVLLSDVPGAPAPVVVVIGHGTAGGAAARLAAAMGAEVVVLGRSPERLRTFCGTVPPTVRCRLNTPEALAEELPRADLVVGAILISNYDTPAMITEELVRRMRPGSVLVDVTCGYGPGYMPTFDRLSTSEEPVYERHGVLHCKIDALPATVPQTAAPAVSGPVAPYLLAFAQALSGGPADPVSDAGRIVAGGEVVHPEVRRQLDVVERSLAAAAAER